MVTVVFVYLRRSLISRSVFHAVLTILCGIAISQAQEPLTTARTQYFPDTTNNIHLEMVFNYNVPDINAETGVVDMVWGSNFPKEPRNVYNTAYIPYSVDNFTNSVAWYQQNHPDWLEYLCDRTTLAFEFGATTLAPIDFANPAVQAYQWANWVDAPLACRLRWHCCRHHLSQQQLGTLRSLRSLRNLGSAIFGGS